MTNLEIDPAVEAGHLRRLLDKQPGCLMRVAHDGLLLAANDASLQLLGVDSLGEALGRPFTTWLEPSQHAQWGAFTAQVILGKPASIECEINAPSGGRRSARLHAVPLTDHPDGVRSMAVTMRDASLRRGLETSLNELAAERSRLQEALEASRARHRLELEEATRAAVREQAELDRDAYESLLQDLESQRLDLQSHLDAAAADGQRLEEALTDAETRCARATEAEGERRRLEEAIRAQCDEANRLETAMRVEAEAAAGEHGHVKAALEARLEEAKNLEAALRTVLEVSAGEHRRLEATLRAQFDEANGERCRLAAALEAREGRDNEQASIANVANGHAVKTAADRLVVLKALTDQVRRLTPHAAAGRAAREIASELRALVTGVDATSTRVLAEIPLDHPTRGDVESLKADSIQAAALAGEFCFSCADTDESGLDPRRDGGERRRA